MDPVIHSLLGLTIAEAVGASGPYEAGLVAAAVGGAFVLSRLDVCLYWVFIAYWP